MIVHCRKQDLPLAEAAVQKVIPMYKSASKKDADIQIDQENVPTTQLVVLRSIMGIIKEKQMAEVWGALFGGNVNRMVFN